MSRTFTVIDAEQRSQEWVAARLGRLTGSRASDMLATIKSGAPSTSRQNLLMQLVLERLTGRSQERAFTSQAMEDGTEREPDALLWYEAVTGQLVERTGFLSHTSLMAGTSLDGHLGDFEVIVEAKSPLPATHWEYLKSGVVPIKYQRQCLHGLWLTGAKRCDWLSFHPDFPENLRAKFVEIHRDEQAVAEYDKQVLAFLAEVDRELGAVRTMADLRGTLAAVVA